MLAAVMETGMHDTKTWDGPVGMMLASELYVSASGDDMGSIVALHTCTGPLNNEHDVDRRNPWKDKLIFFDMLARGQRITNRNTMLLCLPMTDGDLDTFVAAFDEVLGERAHLLAAD